MYIKRKFLLLLTLTIVLLAASWCGAYDYKYYLGLRGGASTLSGGDSAKFTMETTYGGAAGIRLHRRWLVDFSVTVHENYNDTTATSSFSFGGDSDNATLRWKTTRLGATFNRLLFDSNNRFNFTIGAGGGLMLWKMLDPIADTTVDARGAFNEWVDFTASELFLNGTLGLNLMLSPKWSLSLDFNADYLTGAGAEFQDKTI